MHPSNHRDVGETLGLWLDPSPVPPGRLLRGGRIDALTQPSDIGEARTIINLRRGKDPGHLGATLVHVPAPDDVENYATDTRRVAVWVTRALSAIAASDPSGPVYLHCTAGRDRTGVVVAAALVVMGVPSRVITEEYLLSEGATRPLIERALRGLRSLELPARDRAALVRRLCAAP